MWFPVLVLNVFLWKFLRCIVQVSFVGCSVLAIVASLTECICCLDLRTYIVHFERRCSVVIVYLLRESVTIDYTGGYVIRSDGKVAFSCLRCIESMSSSIGIGSVLLLEYLCFLSTAVLLVMLNLINTGDASSIQENRQGTFASWVICIIQIRLLTIKQFE
jgi:hypothetical protein